MISTINPGDLLVGQLITFWCVYFVRSGKLVNIILLLDSFNFGPRRLLKAKTTSDILLVSVSNEILKISYELLCSGTI